MENLTLLVDDDPVVNFVHQRIIEKFCPFGEIKVKNDGREALDFLHDKYPDYNKVLMLLDINMPVMDGWQLLDELSQSDWEKKLVVFMLSSSISKQDMDKASEYKLVEGYLTKPFDQENCRELKQHPELESYLHD